VKNVSRLQFIDYGSFRVLRCLHLFDSMMKVRIKFLADALNSFEALFRESIPELAPNEFETLIVFGISGIVVSGDGAVERVKCRQYILN